MSRSPLHVLFVAASAVALFACSSSESTTSTGSGGSEATTTAATGTGGSASTTGGSTSTGASTGASTGTGSMLMNACTNAADTMIRTDKDVRTISAGCGQKSLGDPMQTYDCIKMGTGLSDNCTTCYADSVVCAAKNCLSKCLSDPASQACSDCRQMFCNPAFDACSGIAPTP